MVEVMYCGNYKVFDGMLLSLLSMAKNTKESIKAHIITMSLENLDPNYKAVSYENAMYIDKMLKEYNKDSLVVYHDVTELFLKIKSNEKNLISIYSPYTLLRLITDRIEGIGEKVIYLDTDTMVKGDIKDLYDIDVEGFEFAVAYDYMGRVFRIHKALRYFNAGIMLLNLKMIKETGIFKKSMELLDEKELWLHDQDALNMLVTKKKMISSRFNRQRKPRRNTVIQHFCKGIRFKKGKFEVYNIKQWEVDKVQNDLNIHVYDDVYEEYFRRKKELEGMLK